MKKIRDGAADYKIWIGQSFVCRSTGSEYELEEQDVVDTVKANGGKKIDFVLCPDCSAKVTFNSSQLGGNILLHE